MKLPTPKPTALNEKRPGGPDRLPLSPGVVAHTCSQHLVDATAYSDPEHYPIYWTGLLIRQLFDDKRSWTFDQDILDFIARLSGGAAFVDRFSQEHTLSHSDYKGLPVLRILRRVLRLMWEANWELYLELMDPDFFERTQNLSNSEYEHQRVTSFAWVIRRPHAAVKAIEDSLLGN